MPKVRISLLTTPSDKPSLEMKIDLNVIDHLGLKMYTSLPAVIAEYVANAWDAGANRVEITVPDDTPSADYTITIRDNGSGMQIDEVNRKFLLVGRNRREDDQSEEIQSIGGETRRVMGRKGLGKLAGFGVAEQVHVRTAKNGNYLEFLMDYGDMLKRVKEGGLEFKTSYSPKVLGWGEIDESNGTVVSLRRLKRKKPVDVAGIKENLARHFSVISPKFEVFVNEKPIKAEDMNLQGQCMHVWEINEELGGEGLTVKGWIGLSSRALPKEAGGIVIMTRGRLVQTPTTFEAGGMGTRGVVYLPSLVGELHAEFLDAEEDMIGTGRRSIIRETDAGQLLWSWGTKKVKEILSEWVDTRAKQKIDEVRKLPVYEERIAKLPAFERNVVEKFLGRLVEKEEVEMATVEKVADFLATGVEYESFLTLVDSIERAEVNNPDVLVEFFRDWEILDAIEMARIVEGRLDVIRKFQEYVESGVREVPELHKFLVDNPWLLDPTWDYLQDEVRISTILSGKFPDDSAGRIDFLCLGHGNSLNIVELKRPTVVIGRKELDQIEDYVDHVSTIQGNDPKTSYKTFVGYIVGARLSSAPGVAKKAQRLEANSMYVKTYSDLQRTAYNSHVRFIQVLNRKSERIKDSRLEASLRRLEAGAKVAVSELENTRSDRT